MFTSNQIEEIRKKLQLGGAKDTQFPLADSLNGNEIISIIQQGVNKQLGLKTFLDTIAKWGISDFLNISKSDEDSYTLEGVLDLVAPINRKAGQVITFKDTDTGTWSIYQFKGSDANDWFNLDYWDDILAKVDNHFKGLVENESILRETYPRPITGDFAFVGNTLESAVLYTCNTYSNWYNTNEPALAYMNEEIFKVVENIFNNIENYPELIELFNKPLLSIKIVTSLPSEGSDGVIYLVLDKSSAENNFYKEYIWVKENSKFEEFGSVTTEMDLEDYVTTVEFNTFKSKFISNGSGNKYLSDDGTYKEVISGIQEIPKATSSVLGGIKTGYNISGKNYPIKTDSNGNAYVNVPWEDNNTTYEKATSTTFGLVKIGYSINGKNYPVVLDSNGKMYVNVPWENTTYTNATQTKDGLMSKEDKIKLDGLAGAYIQIVTLSDYNDMYKAGTLDENTVYHIKG